MKLEKKHWYWIAGIVAVVAIIGGIAIAKKKRAVKKADEDAKKLADSKGQGGAPPPPPASAPATFPLQNGTRGYEVKVLQKYINSTCKSELRSPPLDLYPLDIDGIWGNKTDTAVIKCHTTRTNKIDEPFYRRIYRDMAIANILP